MVNYHDSSLDLTFAALADPTRRAILSRLQRGELRVSELAAPFRMSLPAVSKHLTVLEQAGLVTKRRAGREKFCALAPAPLGDAAGWLANYKAFWETQLDNFAAYVESKHQQEKTRWQQPAQTRRSASAEPSRPPAKKSSKRGPRRSR